MQTIVRCQWCEKDDLYRHYHDTEWGKPSRDDHHLFEHLILETFQAGLSWYTILAKRENFRKAFDNFDVNKIANYKEEKINELLQDAGIIRSINKIKAAINNARLTLECAKEFGSFANYMWQFTNNKTITNELAEMKHLPATSPESDAMAKDMKKRGFKFIGSTTCYAYMQAVGMVNDHLQTCHLSLTQKH
ncbi:MAG: DNA-3-methyladenine glycosylase I [Bacteroidia bacterium]